MRVVEYMRKFQFRDFTVRLWIAGEKCPHPDSYSTTVKSELHQLLDLSDLETAEIALDRFPALNAIEIVGRFDGNGVVLYQDWP